jgi:hypothetical protein
VAWVSHDSWGFGWLPWGDVARAAASGCVGTEADRAGRGTRSRKIGSYVAALPRALSGGLVP